MAAIGMYTSSLSTNLAHLYITYGIILGIGGSLAYAPSLVILGHYFTRRLGLVNGLVTAGSALFTIILPLVLKKLIVAQGVANTLAYLSVLMSLLMVCALTFKERLTKSCTSSASTTAANSQTGLNKIYDEFGTNSVLINRSIWHNKLYLLWTIAIPVALFGYFVPFVHLVKHADDTLRDSATAHNSSDIGNGTETISNSSVEQSGNGVILVTIIGAASGIGRLIFGKIADVPNVNRILLQQIAFVAIGILTMLLVVAKNIYAMSFICAGLGIFDGCFISLLGPIAFDLVGPIGASQAIGFLLGLCSVPLTIGPPIAGISILYLNNSYQFQSSFLSQHTYMTFMVTTIWRSS